MSKYNIRTDNTILDTYESLSVSLNYSLKNLNKINSLNTEWSKTILLPGSKKNNIFFSHIFDVNIDLVTFNPTKRVYVIIDVEGNDVLKGWMQLININILQEDVEYEVSISGILYNFLSELGELKLSDLNLSEYNHTRNQSTIANSWQYLVSTNNSMVQYPVAGHGYVYPYIIYGESTYVNNEILVRDMYPATYVWTILKKIFGKYTIKSKFLDTDYFRSLIVPYVNDGIKISAEEILERTVNIGLTPDVLDASGNLKYKIATTSMEGGSTFLTNSGFLSGYTRYTGIVDDISGELIFANPLIPGTTDQQFDTLYTAGYTGYYDISFYATAYARYANIDGDVQYSGAGSLEYRYFLRKINIDGTTTTLDSSDNPDDPDDYGTRLFKPSDEASHPSPWIDNVTEVVMDMSASNVYLIAGEKIYVEYFFRQSEDVDWVGLGDESTTAQLLFADVAGGNKFTRFTVKPVNDVSNGNEYITLSETLPTGYKQIDFVGDIVNMFKLIITNDEEDPNSIVIEPEEDYYASKKLVLDWEDKLDYSSGYELTPMSELDARFYKYTYTEDSDYYNKLYTEDTKRVYGELTYDSGNEFSVNTETATIKFSPTVNASWNIADRVAPYFVNKVDNSWEPYKAKPRILFYNGLLPTSYLVLEDYYGQDPSEFLVLYNYPYCGMWDHPTAPMNDLSFSSTNKVYYPAPNNVLPVKNIFQRFHKSALNNIVDPNSKLLSGKFKLTSKDIATLDYRNIIFLLGRQWRINEIKDYDASNVDALTTVDLYTINATDYDVSSAGDNNIYTSCPSDITPKVINGQLLYVSASGQYVSAECCSIAGGTFINGVCVLPQGSPIRGAGYARNTNNSNSVNSNEVIVAGRNNYVASDVDGVMVLGRNNSVPRGVKNYIGIGDNMTAPKSNTIQIDGLIIDKSGVHISVNRIQAPKDAVRELFPENTTIQKIKSGTDAVRDVDFSSKTNLINGGTDRV